MQASFISVVLMLLLLTACGEHQQKSKAPTVNEDDVLLQDMEHAIPELERRLMRRMSVHEGLILIRDDDTRFYVLPANSPWLVRCTSSDVSVSLGTALSTSVWEEGLGIDRGIDIELAAPYHTPENCSALALELGKRLKKMLQESAQPDAAGVLR